MLPKSVPVRCRGLDGRTDFFGGQLCAHALAHAPRMHAVEQVTAHQAIAAAAEDVETRAAGDEQMRLTAIGIEEAFEKGLPLRVFVQLVEHGNGWAPAQLIKAERHSQSTGAALQNTALIEIIPVE